MFDYSVQGKKARNGGIPLFVEWTDVSLTNVLSLWQHGDAVSRLSKQYKESLNNTKSKLTAVLFFFIQK